jgi:hypothetical protein
MRSLDMNFFDFALLEDLDETFEETLPVESMTLLCLCCEGNGVRPRLWKSKKIIL